MKQYILVILLLCGASLGVTAQVGMYGAQAGIGLTANYDSKITPAIEGYYLHRITHHLYAGGSLFFQRYSLATSLNTGTTVNYGDVLSISQKSSYLFFSPKIDYGIGYRNYFHVFASFGVGVGGGQQWSYTHAPFWTPPGGSPYGADTISVNTSYNIPSSITRFSFGLSERIPTLGFFNIMLSQEVGFMSGLNKGNPPINTPYMCFQVGIMHKYPHVFVEY